MEWTMYDRSMILLAMTCGWLIAIPLRWLFTLSSSIYWSRKEQQIKTRSGECVYDKMRIETMHGNMYAPDGRIAQLARRIYELEKDSLKMGAKVGSVVNSNEVICEWRNRYRSELKKQLQCQVRSGHKMVFAGGSAESGEFIGFIFKCSICDLEITKTEQELTKKETEHLKGLKLIL